MTASGLDRDVDAIRRWADGALTPCLVILREQLMQNITSMAAFAAGQGVALRPHAKTHKSLGIARLQIAHGAVGVCCAKLSEARALVEAGFDGDILLTSPVVAAPALAMLRHLHDKGARIRVTADHPDAVTRLAQVFSGATRSLEVLIDIDPGLHRTGVADADAAVLMARAITSEKHLRYGGVQFYCGLEQHIERADDRRQAIAACTAKLRHMLDALRSQGLAPDVVTGSGTGSAAFDAASGVFTELQAGSYIFLDRQYTDCEGVADGPIGLAASLFVAARVVSCNTPGMATLDMGFKAMASDAGAPGVIAGPHKGARVVFMGDEHSAIISGAAPFTLGEIVVLQPSHCDPTVNLYDRYHVLDFSRGESHCWPVTARGCVS